MYPNINQNFISSNFAVNNQNINFNNPINNNINQIEIVEDAYPYIKEDKKNIIFKRFDNSIKKVKIPKSLRKNELYSTANKYKKYKYADILSLSLNGRNLDKDESSIDDINDGSEIYIIEELKDVDFEYYTKYLKKHDNEPLITIVFHSVNNTINLRFSYNTKIQEMLKIYLFLRNIPEKYKINYIFSYNALTLNDNNKLIKDIIRQNNARIEISEKGLIGVPENKGKILKATIKNRKRLITTHDIGTLNQIKDFNLYLKSAIIDFDKVKIIDMDGKKNYDENSTFSSIGIRKDFVCKIQYEEEGCGCIIM